MNISNPMRGISYIVVLFAVLVVLPGYLERRDAKLNIEWPRSPIPEHARMVTVQHSKADIQRYVLEEYPSSSLLIAPQADIYYEAWFPEGGCEKNFVIFAGTNSPTYVYHDFLERLHATGKFCTLTFDWRAHGRSEDTPGDMTSELLALDAAALIRHVFGPNETVHVFGWSLGGFVGYQFAITYPSLVSSLVIYGSHSCFGYIPSTSTECNDTWSFPKILFSRGAVMRTLGLKLEMALVAIASKAHQPFSETMKSYFYGLRMEQKVKTPRVWLQVQGAKTFQNLNKISCPFQHINPPYEHLLTGATNHSMALEVARIPKAEPPIVLEDPSGSEYSHFAILEEGGMELIVQHLFSFYEKIE